MNRVAEQEIKDTLKKSEFRGMIATVASTVTVLAAIFFGGLQIVDAVKSSIRIEVDAKISEYEKKQMIKDNKQDADIIEIKNLVNNLNTQPK